MKKLITLLFVLLSVSLYAQNTTITATVVDADGVVWTNGTWKVQFQANPQQSNLSIYNINGISLDPAVVAQTGSIDNSGVFSFIVPQNSTISPANSSWLLTVCPQSSTACGNYAFVAAGTTMNLSSALTQIIPKPRFDAVIGSFGYSDAEAQITSRVGATYYSVTSACQRVYNGTTWSCLGNETGTKNEMLFPGALLSDRIYNTCIAFYGKSGIVLIPYTETSTDSGFGGALLPAYCSVQDQRNIVYGKYGGIGTTPYYPQSGILNWIQWTKDSAISGASAPTLMTNHCEAQSGGFNSYARVSKIVGFSISSNVLTLKLLPTTPATGENLVIAGLTTGTYLNGQTFTVLSTGLSSTSVQFTYAHANVGFTTDLGTLTAAAGSAKSNYQCRYDDLVSRTPGQHQTFGTQVTNYSDGDTYLWGGQVWDIGQSSTPGDEGVIGQTIYLFSGQPQFSATVSAINGQTLTMTGTTNGNYLGEQRALLVTSRNVYSTGTAAVAGLPSIITGTGTAWSSLCPGSTAPCYPTNLFFEFTAETIGGIHIVMPILQITSDTSAQISIIGQGIEGSYNGKITSGAYSIYQGSTIQSVPYTGKVFTTVSAAVGDSSQFQVGDAVMQVGGNNRTMNGATLLLTQNVPVQSNGGSTGVRVVSAGNFPITTGVSSSGAFKSAFLGNWQNYNPTLAPPNWGVTLIGATPPSGYYQANDPINLFSVEKMVCAGTHLNGSNNCLQFDRTAGIDQWELANGNKLIGTDAGGNLGLTGGLKTLGSISNNVGGFGPYSNMLKYSEFDAANPAWLPYISTSCANTITANAALDPNGVGTTAEQFVVAAGCASTGQRQTSPSLTAGLPYTFSLWAKSTLGTENFRYQMAYGACGSNGAVAASNGWTQYSTTCIPASTGPQDVWWSTTTAGATFYIWGASLIQSAGPGIYVHSVATPIAPTMGQVTLGTPVSTSGGGSIPNIVINISSFTASPNQCYDKAGILNGTSTQAMTGLAVGMAPHRSNISDPKAIVGWGVTGGMDLKLWPDAGGNQLDFEVCNVTSSSIITGAISFNIGAP